MGKLSKRIVVFVRFPTLYLVTFRFFADFFASSLQFLRTPVNRVRATSFKSLFFAIENNALLAPISDGDKHRMLCNVAVIRLFQEFLQVGTEQRSKAKVSSHRGLLKISASKLASEHSQRALSRHSKLTKQSSLRKFTQTLIQPLNCHISQTHRISSGDTFAAAEVSAGKQQLSETLHSKNRW